MNNIFWRLFIFLLYFAGRSILQRPDRRGTNHLLTNSSIWRFCSRILRQMFFFHWKLNFTTDSWRSQSQWPQEQVNIIYFHEFFVLFWFGPKPFVIFTSFFFIFSAERKKWRTLEWPQLLMLCWTIPMKPSMMWLWKRYVFK